MDFAHTRKVLDDYGRELVTRYREELAADGNDGGSLYSTMSFTVNFPGGADFKIVLNVADYWKYTDYGRRPGKFPPKEPIDRWISYRRIVPHTYTLSSGKTVTPTVQQLSFLIRRKIAREGTEGKRYFERTYSELKESLVSDLKEAIVEDITGKDGLL